MKKFFLVGGGIILALALFVGIWLITAREMPVTAEDKALLVTVSELESYFDFYEPSLENETISKTKYIDGLQELIYDYYSEHEDAPYISSTVSRESTHRDAILTYAIEWSAQSLDYGLSDFKIVEDNNFYSVGPKSRFGKIMIGSEVVGHTLVVHKGKKVYAFTVTGRNIDDPEIWHELFDKRIEKL